MPQVLALALMQLGFFAIGVVMIYGAMVYFAKPPTPPKTKQPGFVGWSPTEAVGITIAIFVIAQIIGAVIVVLALLATQHGTEDAVELLRSSSWAQFIYLAVIDLVSLGAVLTFLERRSTNLAAIGWVRPRWMDLLYVLGGFVVYLLIFGLAIGLAKALFPQLDLNQRQDLGFSSSDQGVALVPTFLSLVILPPLLEETLMRGVLFSGLRTRLNLLWAAVITSVIFGLAHLFGGAEGSIIWIAAIDTMILSFVLVGLREKTGSLWPCVGLHATKNLIAFVALFVLHVR